MEPTNLPGLVPDWPPSRHRCCAGAGLEPCVVGEGVVVHFAPARAARTGTASGVSAWVASSVRVSFHSE